MQRLGDLESGDIIKFYNDVFVITTKSFLVQLGTNSTMSSPSKASVADGDDGKITSCSMMKLK